MLQNSTKEYILATMVHEVMHSYLDYITFQLSYRIESNDLTDTTKWAGVFRAFNDDNFIASNYIPVMSDFLRQYNNSIDSTMAIALTWGGLSEIQSLENKKRHDIY